MDKEYKGIENENEEKPKDKKNHSRSPYTDMGLMLAIGIFITMTVKGLIFGFTWSGITLPVIAGVYFIVYAIYRSRKVIMNASTTTFIVLSVLCTWAEFSSHKNVRPQMPVFHDMTNDTTMTTEEQDLLMESIPDIQATTVEDTLTRMPDSTSIQPEEVRMQEKENADSIANHAQSDTIK
ncbi:MAG: hypothetical protein LUD00_08785 [Prevotellaceae bacterium]|nr:hypothetical protein [Prevotellaceae bacterium]